jgi:hypothetical protein
MFFQPGTNRALGDITIGTSTDAVLTPTTIGYMCGIYGPFIISSGRMTDATYRDLEKLCTATAEWPARECPLQHRARGYILDALEPSRRYLPQHLITPHIGLGRDHLEPMGGAQ